VSDTSGDAVMEDHAIGKVEAETAVEAKDLALKDEIVVDDETVVEEAVEEDVGPWWLSTDYEFVMRNMAANADVIADWASGCPMSHIMPDGFHSETVATSPLQDHWWVGPMEAAQILPWWRAKRRGRATVILEAAIFGLVDNRALIWVQTFEQ